MTFEESSMTFEESSMTFEESSKTFARSSMTFEDSSMTTEKSSLTFEAFVNAIANIEIALEIKKTRTLLPALTCFCQLIIFETAFN